MASPPDAWQIMVRLAATLAAVAVIGIEREGHGRAAGLRTIVLVGLAAAAVMLLQEASGGSDRLAASILTGIGFLGAGAIVKEGLQVQGMTTAALLWLAAVLGMILGSGHLLLGGLVWAIAMASVRLLHRVEAPFRARWHGVISLRLAHDGADEEAVSRRLVARGLRIRHLAVAWDAEAGERTLRLQCEAAGGAKGIPRGLFDDLRSLPGIRAAAWE